MKIQSVFSFMLIAMLISAIACAGLIESDKPWEETSDIVKVSPLFSYTSAEPEKSYIAALIIDISPGWHINSAIPTQVWSIAAELKTDSVEGISVSNVKYPEAHNVPLLGEEYSVYDGKSVIYFQVNLAESIPEGNITLPLHFTYQSCDDKECRAPKTADIDFIITVGSGGKPVESEIFAGFDFESLQQDNNQPSVTAPAEKSQLEEVIDKYGFWGYFLALGLAFLAGLLLSFSPCTYPMIPITVSVFAGQERSMGKGFIHSLFYVGSMAVMYGIMGLIVSLVGGVFGAWLASPPVVIGIAIVFVIFSLSMFGLYELNVPNSLRQKLGTTKSKGGIMGSIILGIVAALVVSPCVGPFVGGILLYIATYGSPVFGFITLFVFALGLGTLFIIIGTFSSTITKLPGAGDWMDQVKGFFGFVLLMMALYFLRTLISPVITAAIAGFLFVALSVFGGGFDRLESASGFFPRLKKFIGVMAFIAGIYLLLGVMISQGFILPGASKMVPSIGSQSEIHLIPWETDLEKGLARAKSERKPVLIDTWATWCVNCRVLEKKTFNKPDVAAEAARFVPLKIQLEKSDSPETNSFKNRFGMKQYSLPTVLLLDADGNVRKILQGVTGPEKMIAEMQKIK